MTVEELIEELHQYEPETEVRLAQQPHWPFEYAIGRVAEVKLAADRDLETIEDRECPEEERWAAQERIDGAPRVVYLAEAEQLGYLPAAASAELGWR